MRKMSSGKAKVDCVNSGFYTLSMGESAVEARELPMMKTKHWHHLANVPIDRSE